MKKSRWTTTTGGAAVITGTSLILLIGMWRSGHLSRLIVSEAGITFLLSSLYGVSPALGWSSRTTNILLVLVFLALTVWLWTDGLQHPKVPRYGHY